MNTPTPTEIAALLALPAEAQDQLAVNGVGWHIRRGQAGTPGYGPCRFSKGGLVAPWLPADPTQILDPVVGIVSEYASLRMYETEWAAVCGSDEARGETARLAALLLLTSVWQA